MHASMVTLLASASVVLANCYGEGADWATQRAFALQKAQEVCELKFAINPWTPDQIMGACYNLDSTKKVDFVVERVSDDTPEREITVEECYDGLQKEINNCDHGGKTAYGNWKYISDPNEGQCNPDN